MMRMQREMDAHCWSSVVVFTKMEKIAKFHRLTNRSTFHARWRWRWRWGVPLILQYKDAYILAQWISAESVDALNNWRCFHRRRDFPVKHSVVFSGSDEVFDKVVRKP